MRLPQGTPILSPDPSPVVVGFPTLREQIWADHWALAVVLVAYFVAASAYFAWLGRWDWWEFRWTYPTFTAVALIGSGGRLLLSRLARSPSRAILSTRRIAGAAVVFAVVCPFQSTFNSIKHTLDDVRGFPWDPALARADALVHAGRQPWEWLTPLVNSAGALRWLDWLYMLWFPCLVVFLVWAAWTPDRVLRQRALLTALLAWMVCGVVLAFVLASAGPCYYPQVVPASTDPFAPLMKALNAQHERHFLFAVFNQRGIWAASQQGVWVPLGGISAMPSMHVAMAVLFALVARPGGWPLHAAAWAYALVIQVGSVVLGWHYAIDGYVAGAVTVGLWRLSARVVPDPGRHGDAPARRPVVPASIAV